MENDKELENKYITRDDLGEQTQILLEAFDKRFNKMENHFDKRLDEVRDDLRMDINNLQTSADGLVKRQSDFEDEQVIMKEEVKQMKRALKDKLDVVIKAA